MSHSDQESLERISDEKSSQKVKSMDPPVIRRSPRPRKVGGFSLTKETSIEREKQRELMQKSRSSINRPPCYRKITNDSRDYLISLVDAKGQSLRRV